MAMAHKNEIKKKYSFWNIYQTFSVFIEKQGPQGPQKLSSLKSLKIQHLP